MSFFLENFSVVVLSLRCLCYGFLVVAHFISGKILQVVFLASLCLLDSLQKCSKFICQIISPLYLCVSCSERNPQVSCVLFSSIDNFDIGASYLVLFALVFCISALDCILMYFSDRDVGASQI